ncbi:hypothetical protein ON010_g14552 [Phytophthora cinnamomi]|nr:hypothetical protein ON010_g14552 [Phytophthora cinnamomi]
MELGRGLALAVAAVNQRLVVLIFGGHALALQKLIDAGETDAHASIAAVAVKVVDIQALADAADFALVAMIDVFAVVVVDELAHLAVVAAELAFAILVTAGFPDRLERDKKDSFVSCLAEAQEVVVRSSIST